MTTDPIRVVLVDDHPVVRHGVRLLLSFDLGLEVVGEVGSHAAALDATRLFKPHVVILDLKMPDGRAATLIPQLRAAAPAPEVLVFTSFLDEVELPAVLDAGARGYLLKDCAEGELVRAVKAVAQGESALAASAQQFMIKRSRGRIDGDRFSDLSEREHSVLKLIAIGRNNKQIARELNLTHGTVRGYVSTIFAKLGVRDRTQAALLAVQEGYLRRNHE
jgi:DNA-binding NarL/FixJ family response regulator